MNTTSSWFRPTLRTVRTFASMLLLAVCAEPTAPPRAEKVVFLTGPASATAGTAFDPALRVAIQDASGNVITSINGNVTLALQTNPTSATLLGTTTVMSVNGVATFPDVRIEKAGAGYTIVATSTGLTLATSVAFDIAAGAPATTTLIAGSETAIAGAALATPPGVTVHDAFGNPVSGATVTFAVTEGGGSLTDATQTTDADGVATLGGWILGTSVGTNSITATVTGSSAEPLTISATGTVGPPSQIAVEAGDAQTATAGSAVAVAPSVIVKDANDNPVSGANVTFAVASGGGALTGNSTTTNAAGVATVGSWTLGAVTGANTLTATVSGIDPVTFSAVGTAGAATQIALVAGDAQTAVAGSAVATKPSVVVKDANGNVVSGTSVTFSVASGGGSVTGGTTTTDANGVATVGGWTLGTTAGGNSLTATFAGLSGSPVTFNATGVAGAAAQIQLDAGDGQTEVAGSAVTTKPSVVVKDANGNVVSGATVTFAVLMGEGSVTGGTATTDANGVATVGSWTLGTTVGTNVLTVSVAGLDPVMFNAIGVAGAAAQVEEFLGNGQTAVAGAHVPVTPAVVVKDANGNVVSGVSVTFAVASGGGSVGGATTSTDEDGVAQVAAWNLGTVVGTNTLTATVAGLAPVTFTATGITGPATLMEINEGDGQTAVAGSALAIMPSVIVTDGNGNPVQGAFVAFSLQVGSGGSLQGGSFVTNENGIATAGNWMPSQVAGVYVMTATSEGIAGSLTFTATAIPGPGATVQKLDGDVQTGVAGEALAMNPSVIVMDQFGNAVPDVSVTFSVFFGGGSVTGGNTTTDANGIATVGSWTLGPVKGVNNVFVLVNGVGNATFTATGVAGTPTQVDIVQGDGQTGDAGEPLDNFVIVAVKDAHGNGVQNASVTFAVASGGGSVSTESVNTGFTGNAQVSWTLGTAVGPNSLTATTDGPSGSPLTVTFNATAVAGDPKVIELQSGGNQTKPAGTALDEISVLVKDQYGNPVDGATVSWFLLEGGGSVLPNQSQTANGGIATTVWTLGGQLGQQRISANAFGANSLSIFATATVGAPASISVWQGNEQSSTVGQSTSTAPIVRVLDAFSNPVPNATVTWTVLTGGGSVGDPSTTTEGGFATGEWTLGTTAGSNTMKATVAGVESEVTFSATGVAGPATQIAMVGGNDQTAVVNSILPTAISVIVTDTYGNPVKDVPISFSGGSANPSLVSTGDDGIASTTWTLGLFAGDQQLFASRFGLTGSPLTFSATALAGPAASIQVNSGDFQQATVNTNVAEPPSVMVTDQFGNIVSGVTVTFSVAPGEGTITGATPTTDANGVATLGSWKLGTTAGEQTLSVTFDGNPSPITVTATALAGDPASFTITAGNEQTGTEWQELPVVLTAILKDAFGNPVQNSLVTLSVTSLLGGSVTPAVNTNEFGGVTAAWTLGAAGAHTVRLAVANDPNVFVDFTATAIAP